MPPSSRWCSVSLGGLQAWGWYLPGKTGTRSLISLPRHMVDESFVAGSGVFRYWRMASMSRSPLLPTLPVTNRLVVWTPLYSYYGEMLRS